jgi:hypothetical protein
MHSESIVNSGCLTTFTHCFKARVFIAYKVKLRRNGQLVTDIDAAILDKVTGDLVLFQLKWQDFTTSNVRAQRSKAKNFSSDVERWAKKTALWIKQFGISGLCKALQIKQFDCKVKLIAIGRSNARFRSYGYDAGPDVLVLTWSQMARLRLAIGPGQSFFELLKVAVHDEAQSPTERTPMPYTLESHNVRLVFQDIWSSLEKVGQGVGKD